jgi:methylthioribulose-1-phosphate dehydratase
MAPTFSPLAEQLVEAGRDFYTRGWALGTSGNFSAVVSRDPLRLAITESGVDKALLGLDHIVEVDGDGRAIRADRKPSAETAIHLAVARSRDAGAVMHTHSVWGTLLSDATTNGGLSIEGYEMLKGLEGVRTDEHRETIPVIENTQDWATAASAVESLLRKYPTAHGFLIRRHGLYTWGRDVADARRHVEILEFLFEVIGRKRG